MIPKDADERLGGAREMRSQDGRRGQVRARVNALDSKHTSRRGLTWSFEKTLAKKGDRRRRQPRKKKTKRGRLDHTDAGSSHGKCMPSGREGTAIEHLAGEAGSREKMSGCSATPQVVILERCSERVAEAYMKRQAVIVDVVHLSNGRHLMARGTCPHPQSRLRPRQNLWRS